MKLREFLDEVRFGNTARLCVAIKGDYDFLDNYEEGMYWELPSGNWEDGSKSEAFPVIPEEIMDAEVIEIDASPNLQTVYGELGQLCNQSLDTTLIMVNAPGFDEDSYWTDDKLNDYMGCESCYGHEWAYAISEDLWEHIQNLESDWGKLSMAVAHIVMFGLGTVKGYTEKDCKCMGTPYCEIMRQAKKIAMLLDNNINELLALCELLEIGSAFNRSFMDR